MLILYRNLLKICTRQKKTGENPFSEKMSQKQRRNFYWSSVIHEIERIAKKKTNQHRIKNYDFYSTMPHKLHQRVAQIIPLDFCDDQNKSPVQQKVELGATSDRDLNIQPEDTFDESTYSLVERKEREYPQFDLNLEYTKEIKTSKQKRKNWYTSYICNDRKDRVKWKSKIYQMETSIWEKPLDEQAEQLMDASAERFTEWVNTLGSGSEKDMTKEQLKSLFSIEGNAKLLSSVQTDPKEVKAIARTVADRWNLPEMAIELKYENYIKSRFKKAPQKPNTVAFGVTIPYKERPWIHVQEEIPIETIFPDELCSGEHLFKGIAHLRSTKALIEHCKKKPKVPRPRYLVENGYFKTTSKVLLDPEVPLYELLKNK